MQNIVWHPEHVSPPRPGQVMHGAEKYYGEVARGYREKRDKNPKWLFEDAIIKAMLDELPKDSWVLDCPVGDGRFIPFYEEKGFFVRAVDLSNDMLGEAFKQVTRQDERVLFKQGDVRQLPLANKQVDAAVMCRLTRWLTPEDCVVALKELQRVTKKKIIFTARVADHPHARPVELFESALDGWKIARMEAMPDDPAYRVIECRPA